MLIGYSAAVKTANKIIREAAKTHDHVIILGEPGTGKHWAATLIHQKSPGRSRAFISLNGACLNNELDLLVLFGQEKSIDNEVHRQLGTLQKVGQGTLYIENIHQLPQAYKDLFFRLLTHGAISIPGSGVEIKQNFRFIVTAPDIDTAQTALKSPPLWGMLSQFQITLPSLAKRREDLPHLFAHFLESVCQETGIEVPPVSEDIYESLMSYDWGGNVDELKNAVRNLVLLSPQGRLYSEYLPFEVRKHPFSVLEDKELPVAIAEVERYLIHKALQRFAGNQTKAAHLLNVSEAALRYKMKKFGLSKHTL